MAKNKTSTKPVSHCDPGAVLNLSKLQTHTLICIYLSNLCTIYLSHKQLWVRGQFYFALKIICQLSEFIMYKIQLPTKGHL